MQPVPEINMGSSIRGRYWSLLQLVVIIICCRGIASNDEPVNSTGDVADEESKLHDHIPDSDSTVVSSYVEHTTEQDQLSKANEIQRPEDRKVAQDCVGSRLMLNCPDMKVIQITAAVLGDSDCHNIFWSSCCINDSDCTQNPNENHRRDVKRRCDNKRSCTVDVLKERIDCGVFGKLTNNDFERITYNCRDDPQNKTMNSTERSPGSESTVTSYVEHTTEQERDHPSIVTSAGTTLTLYNNTKEGDQVDPAPATQKSSSQVIPVVVGFICLIILLSVVVLVAIVVHQRKKSALEKLSHPVPMSKIDNHQNETDVHANEIQMNSEHKTNYAMIPKVDEVDEADFPETGQDLVVYSEVEQRTTIWNGQGQTADQNRTAHHTQMVGFDAYEEVGEPSKSVSSVFKTDKIGSKGVVNMGNCFTDNIYELKSHDMEDIYVKESATDPGKHLVADDVLNVSMPQDDDGQTVIENDLYSH